jgi:hypothetical protein
VKRKTFASARFGVCVNVFAQSRIYFDASLGAPVASTAVDRALAACAAAETDTGADGERVSHGLPPGAAQITIH